MKNKTKEKSRKPKALYKFLASLVSKNFNIKLSSSQMALKTLQVLAKPFRAMKSAQRFLANYLQNLQEKNHKKNTPEETHLEKILEALERFGPSNEIYKANSLKLYYTSGIEFMAKECRAWNLIMHIKPIFEMLYTREFPVAIKIQGKRKNRTKVTYYASAPGEDVPGREYVAMSFPLKELVLFYRDGVLMLASEYGRVN